MYYLFAFTAGALTLISMITNSKLSTYVGTRQSTLVNFTAGLERIRTSPDHGTAFDIAGKNIANFDSFKEAVFSAITIFKTREEYVEISYKPLPVSKKKVPSKKNY